ncbi:glycosyltransferase family 2 protein [uncultured Paenibacillus sp.]|uniref:glycosyltransferase family 2 protein n=1 Tax=uncultured Paenibacillus sp. TaxID=227322 RepID=UPI0015ACAB27|nr:glycosyltransferase family 2 protein [uncultured Paenibacillus sp.]
MEDNKLSISVIVPMFNTEEYIQETISSLLSQSFQNIEMIFIDDCSTDRTYELASFYASNYDNILLFRQLENKGVSAARNAGLAKARGEYIFFLDSDDTLPSDALEKLFTAAIRTQADIVTGIYDRFDKKGTSISNIFNIHPELKIEGQIDLYNTPSLLYSVYSCGKLFKRDIIVQATFLETLNYGEDQIFTIEALLQAKRVYNLSSVIYNYRVRDGETESLSQSVYKDPVRNFEYLKEMLRVIDKLFVRYISDPKVRLKLFSVYLSRALHWNIWTAVSHGLLSMNMSTRFIILSHYESWVDSLNSELYEANRSDFQAIHYKIGKIRSVLDQRTQELCDLLLLKSH